MELVGVAQPQPKHTPTAMSDTSRDSRVEQNETPLSVEKLLDLERGRLMDLSRGIAGFHVRGTEWHLLSSRQGSPKFRNL